MSQQCERETTCPVNEDWRLNAVDEMVAHANAELGRSPYQAVRHVVCEYRGGILILHGRVPSYFQKQVAQAVVCRSFNGGVPLANRVEVAS